VALPAPVHVVDLDDAGQLAVGIAFEHGLQELVLDAPGGRVGHPELALELQCGDGVLLLGKQVQGEKPGGQRQLAVGEHRAGGEPSRWRKVCIASDLDAMEAFPPELVVSGVIYMPTTSV